MKLVHRLQIHPIVHN